MIAICDVSVFKLAGDFVALSGCSIVNQNKKEFISICADRNIALHVDYTIDLILLIFRL